MPLIAPELDDLRFQRLVDEARKRIPSYCPEWTDYNVSDPGITLIELFAYMTEQLGYRLNRVPEKMYLKFLDLLGVHLLEPASAKAPLTFWLSTQLPMHDQDHTRVEIPAGTAAGTLPRRGETQVVFSTLGDLVLQPPELFACYAAGDTTNHTELLHRSADALALLPEVERPEGVDALAQYFENAPGLRVFGNTPERGWFVLGFRPAPTIRGYLLRLDFACVPELARGIDPTNPPWVWEYETYDEQRRPVWRRLRTGILPGEKGQYSGLDTALEFVVLYLPLEIEPVVQEGVSAFWLRCRPLTAGAEEGNRYERSPHVRGIAASCIGGAVGALQMETSHDEMLGRATGDPGQIFNLQHAPVIRLPDADETVLEVIEVEEDAANADAGGATAMEWSRRTTFAPWTQVADFAQSTRYDRHVMLDRGTGEVIFGPSVRQQDGSMRQYGRVPGPGCAVRIGAYHYGQGSAGNIARERVATLLSTIPLVHAVRNLEPADGGLDLETLEEARMRVRRLLRTQDRAVTLEDFETLALTADQQRSIARAKSVQAATGVWVAAVPRGFDPVRAPELHRLLLPGPLRDDVTGYLNARRLLLTPEVAVAEADFVGVQAQVTADVMEGEPPWLVKQRIDDVLLILIAPLGPGRDARDEWTERIRAALDVIENAPAFLAGARARATGQDVTWQGWPFGRALQAEELRSLLERIPGVKAIRDIQLCSRPIRLRREAQSPTAESQAPAAAPAGVVALGDGVLPCSLGHEVKAQWSQR